MEQIKHYFPNLNQHQYAQLEQLLPLYKTWNEKINVVSRKDIDHLYERHVLHALAIARVIQFKAGTKVVDIGTGGGFPGIPLAIYFPEVHFHLVDSIGKKIRVAEAIVDALALPNVTAEKSRAEQLSGKFDFVVSRAVTCLPVFYSWVSSLLKPDSQNALPNGVLYLKGGEFFDELKQFSPNYTVYPISDYFKEEYFETKKLVHLFQK